MPIQTTIQEVIGLPLGFEDSPTEYATKLMVDILTPLSDHPEIPEATDVTAWDRTVECSWDVGLRGLVIITPPAYYHAIKGTNKPHLYREERTQPKGRATSTLIEGFTPEQLIEAFQWLLAPKEQPC